MSGQWHYNMMLPQRHERSLRSVSNQTGLSLAELVRRFIDHCLQGDALNVIVPSMSGRLEVGKHADGAS